MSSPIFLAREYHGSPTPPGSRLPSPHELHKLFLLSKTKSHPDFGDYDKGTANPQHAPVFWIKFGRGVTWNEVMAQSMAYHELQRLGSPVRAPALFYACEMKIPAWPWKEDSFFYRGFAVMEYIPGMTAGQLLEDIAEDIDREARQDFVYSKIALALSELLRIPVPSGQKPSSVNEDLIRHSFFEDPECPIFYKSAQQIEDHLNKWLQRVRRSDRFCVKNLSLEPMVFCYMDVWLHNFIIDHDENIVVIDFADVSFLPSSFFKYVLSADWDKIQRDISDLVQVPTTEGVDNTMAMRACKGPMTMASSAFDTMGRDLVGRDRPKAPHREHTPLRNEQGRPVERSHSEVPYPVPK